MLTARLLSRGREADPAEVASRVARATAANPVGDHVLQINNVGSVANGVAACVAALRGQLRYSMWLVRALLFALDLSTRLSRSSFAPANIFLTFQKSRYKFHSRQNRTKCIFYVLFLVL